ncbi:carboxymuconolactone decarboxylase family protein [soil metagenome]
MNPETPLAVSTRLPLRPPPYEADVQKAIGNTAFTGGLSPQNLRLSLANHPKLAAAFQAMAHVVLFKCEVPEREREIAIIRTGALTRSEYEWGMHVSIYGDKCGLGSAQIRELTVSASWRDLSPALWTPTERLIVRMVDELHHHSTVSDESWRQMSAHWPKEQVMELLFASSFYHMAAFFLNSAAVPLEDGSERFPEGVAQAAVPA